MAQIEHMDELAEIAASVALALGLDGNSEPPVYELHSGNVFDDPWFRLCVLWLLERGSVTMGAASIYFDDDDESGKGVGFGCPAAEFPARAVHHLISAAARPAPPYKHAK